METMKLGYHKKIGWILSVTDKNLKCRVCGSKIKPPFYYCENRGRCFCHECSKKNRDNCGVMPFSDDHIHYCIRHIEVPKDVGVVKMQGQYLDEVPYPSEEPY